jgi:hypothetical protein
MPWTKSFFPPSAWQPVQAGPFKKWYHIYGYLKNKLGPGQWQVRYPDATITYPNGTRQVYDCKFTRANGRADVWGTQPGQYSRQTQLQDYRQINLEQGHPTVGPPELSRAACLCDDKEKKQELKPREIPIPELAPGMYFVPIPAPGTFPLPAPGPAPMPVPLRFPIPVFGW